jgi:ankyrin repeat protein
MIKQLPLFLFATIFIMNGKLAAMDEQKTVATVHAGMQLLRLCRDPHARSLNGKLGIRRINSCLTPNADLAICDRQGSALMWLAFFDRRDLYNLLLERGALLTTTSPLGYTALHAAAQQNHFSIVEDISEKQALQIDIKAACGSTALHLAAQAGAYEVVVLLLSQQASVCAQDCYGRTPLHLAVWAGKKDVCRALLKAGADSNSSMNRGIRPLHLATYLKNSDISDMLRLFGAWEECYTISGCTLAECIPAGAIEKDLCAVFMENNNSGQGVESQECQEDLDSDLVNSKKNL